MPNGSKPVLHGLDGRLGLGHEFLVDEIGWQGAIDYVVLDSPAAAFALWRKLGATHVSWFRDRGGTAPEDLAREAVFARTLQQYASSELLPVGARILTKLREAPAQAALATAPTRIAWLGCGGDPATGLYSPRELARRNQPGETSEQRERAQRWEEKLSQSPRGALTQANALIVRASCPEVGRMLDGLRTEFEMRIQAGDVTVWARHRPHPLGE
jgi:hypothetical protein